MVAPPLFSVYHKNITKYFKNNKELDEYIDACFSKLFIFFTNNFSKEIPASLFLFIIKQYRLFVDNKKKIYSLSKILYFGIITNKQIIVKNCNNKYVIMSWVRNFNLTLSHNNYKFINAKIIFCKKKMHWLPVIFVHKSLFVIKQVLDINFLALCISDNNLQLFINKIISNKSYLYNYSNKLQATNILDIIWKIILKFKEKINIKRYKGLGEMNPEQLWHTTMNPKTRRILKIIIDDEKGTGKLFSVLMGNDVEQRRLFIENIVLDV